MRIRLEEDVRGLSESSVHASSMAMPAELLLLLDEKYGLIESKESHNRQSQQPSAHPPHTTQAGLPAATNQGDDPMRVGNAPTIMPEERQRNKPATGETFSPRHVA